MTEVEVTEVETVAAMEAAMEAAAMEAATVAATVAGTEAEARHCRRPIPHQSHPHRLAQAALVL